MPDITALFWDIGGVILSNAWDRNSRRAAVENFSLDWDDFEDRHELLLHAFETGQLTLEEYLNRAIFYRSRPFSREEFTAFIYQQSRACPGALRILARAASGKRYFNAALNNESGDLNEFRIGRFELHKYFQVFLSSCYLGVRKPDGKIYRLALSITQRHARECVFIDDRPLNLECAGEMGMHTIAYQNSQQLQTELSALGVSINHG